MNPAMKPVMAESLNLSSSELALVVELLELAHARLPVEIRHTDNRAYREELRRRLEIVEQLVERIHPK
jgi:hypothetical protein